MVKALIALLKWGGFFWVLGASLFVLVGIADIWMRKGFIAVLEFLGPSNVLNWVVVVLTLAPGFVALSWAATLKEGSFLIRRSDAH